MLGKKEQAPDRHLQYNFYSLPRLPEWSRPFWDPGAPCKSIITYKQKIHDSNQWLLSNASLSILTISNKYVYFLFSICTGSCLRQISYDFSLVWLFDTTTTTTNTFLFLYSVCIYLPSKLFEIYMKLFWLYSCQKLLKLNKKLCIESFPLRDICAKSLKVEAK